MKRAAVAGVAGAAATTTTTAGPLVFAQMADSQLGFMDEDKTWHEEIELCGKAVAAINMLRPQFAIMCGDLTNKYPTDEEKMEKVRQQQVEDYKKAFEKIDPDIPLLCVCGNHDVGNRPTATTITKYERDFGASYFSFWISSQRVAGVVVNSNLWSDDQGAPEAAKEQMEWFEQTLKMAKNTYKALHILIFTHHPLFLLSADENAEQVDKVLGRTTWTTPEGKPAGLGNSYFHIPAVRRTPVIELLQQYGVQFVFSGHWHRNHVVEDTSVGVTQVVTSAVGRQLGADSSGLRFVRICDSNVTHRYYSFDTIPDTRATLDADLTPAT